MSATTTATKPKISKTTSPPIVASRSLGPLMATTAALAPRVARSWASFSGVSYRLWLPTDW